jgi:hypothetical protein
MEPDDAFLDALLSKPAPPPPASKAKLRVPGDPPPSADAELTAELRPAAAGSSATLEIRQPSTGWSAILTLPVGETIDVDSLAVQRSKRSGTVYVRYLPLTAAAAADTGPQEQAKPEFAPEPEPPLQPQAAASRAAASRETRVKKLATPRQSTAARADPAAEDASSPTAVAMAQFLAAGGDALRGDDGRSETDEFRHWRRRFLRGISAATRAVRGL